MVVTTGAPASSALLNSLEKRDQIIQCSLQIIDQIP